VLEQAARVRVVAVGRGGIHAQRRLGEHVGDVPAERLVVDLRREHVDETLQLVRVAAKRRRQGRGVGVGRLESAHLQLQPVAELLDPAEDVHGVALAEARVEQFDVAPHPSRDAPGRVGELEREVRGAAPSV
jgi:hypothetical protein